MLTITPTLISQYATSPTLVQVLENLNQYIDPTIDLDNFYNLVWNVDTAVGFGLEIWGRIVGVQRVIQVPVEPLFFGFVEAGTYSAEPFGFGQFWDGVEPVTAPYSLGDTEFRALILAKALANITNGSIPAINQILLNLFPGRGNCYVTDGLNMTMTYTFQFALTAVEYATLSQSGVLPKPAGVYASLVIA